jgi:hypothetical protein
MQPLTAKRRVVGKDSSDILVGIVKGGIAPSKRRLTPVHLEMLVLK